ncbi:MAG: T9SS type A sorting domain-containing protein [Bacteroidota bacterium]
MNNCTKRSRRFIAILILITLAMGFQSSFGQNDDYKLIRSDYLFIIPNNPYGLGLGCYLCGYEQFITGIRIDSTAQRNDNVSYYFNREIIERSPNDCIFIGPSIIGDSIAEDADSLTKCYNIAGEEIVINRSLKPGESAKVYTYADSGYITATVSSHLVETIIQNISDSVKTYLFQRYDSNSDPLDDPVNLIELKISKNYGLIQYFNFRDFPEIERPFEIPPLIINQRIISNSLINPEEYYLTYGDIYDFEIGDVFHYSNDKDALPWSGTGKEYIIREVIGKESGQNNDSTWYTFREKRWGWKPIHIDGEDREEYYSIDDTLTRLYTNQNEYILAPEVMPFEAEYLEEFTAFANSLMYRNPDYYNNRIMYRKYGLELTVQDCMSAPHDSYGGTFYIYVKGCGSLRNTIMAEIEFLCIPCEHLVYYHKGDEVWGEPLGISDSKSSPLQINIFPNPASDQIQIESIHEIYTLKLFNALGAQVFVADNLWVNTCQVDLSEFESGLYVMEIRTIEGDISMKKVLIVE